MWGMDPTARFQENLRRLAMIDDGFIEGQAGLGLALDTASALDPKTAAQPRPRWRPCSVMTSPPRWKHPMITESSLADCLRRTAG